MKVKQTIDTVTVFRAPVLFVVLFYGVILIWTAVTLPFIYLKFSQGRFQGDWLYAVMIGFFYFYTWFWCMGLFTSISMDPAGRVVLKSVRRRVELSAKQIRAIEGSRFSGGFGFIKLKLPRESGYLFCYRRNKQLDEILEGMRKMNPLLKTIRI
jgi:hypothetical protein